MQSELATRATPADIEQASARLWRQGPAQILFAAGRPGRRVAAGTTTLGRVGCRVRAHDEKGRWRLLDLRVGLVDAGDE